MSMSDCLSLSLILRSASVVILGCAATVLAAKPSSGRAGRKALTAAIVQDCLAGWVMVTVRVSVGELWRRGFMEQSERRREGRCRARI